MLMYQIFITDPKQSSQQDPDIETMNTYLAARDRFDLLSNKAGPLRVALFSFDPKAKPTRKLLRETTVYES